MRGAPITCSAFGYWLSRSRGGTYNRGVTDSQLQIRIVLTSPVNLGPGKIRLLRAIGDSGSISGAARQLKISYRRAWLMVDNLNRAFPSVLVDAAVGGQRGGGAHLTVLGEDVLRRYEALTACAEAAVAEQADGLLRLARGR